MSIPIEQLNKQINDAIEKYDLEGHETVFGGMVWFALCLQTAENKCINDHLENKTYSFTTPKYFRDHDNSQEISDIIGEHCEIMDQKLKEIKNPSA